MSMTGVIQAIQRTFSSASLYKQFVVSARPHPSGNILLPAMNPIRDHDSLSYPPHGHGLASKRTSTVRRQFWKMLEYADRPDRTTEDLVIGTRLARTIVGSFSPALSLRDSYGKYFKQSGANIFGTRIENGYRDGPRKYFTIRPDRLIGAILNQYGVFMIPGEHSWITGAHVLITRNSDVTPWEGENDNKTRKSDDDLKQLTLRFFKEQDSFIHGMKDDAEQIKVEELQLQGSAPPLLGDVKRLYKASHSEAKHVVILAEVFSEETNGPIYYIFVQNRSNKKLLALSTFDLGPFAAKISTNADAKSWAAYTPQGFHPSTRGKMEHRQAVALFETLFT